MGSNPTSNNNNNIRNLLAVVNLVISDDSTEILEVYEGDNVIELVQTFCMKHDLQEDCVSHMVKHINQQINQTQIKNDLRRQQQQQQQTKESLQHVAQKKQTSIQSSQEEVEEIQSLTTSNSSSKQMAKLPKQQQQQQQQQQQLQLTTPKIQPLLDQQLYSSWETNEQNPLENHQKLQEPVSDQEQQLFQDINETKKTSHDKISLRFLIPPPNHNSSAVFADQSGLISKQSKQSHKQLRFNLEYPPEQQHNSTSESISISKLPGVQIPPSTTTASNHHHHLTPAEKSSAIANYYSQPHRNANTANRFVSSEKALRRQCQEEHLAQEQQQQQSFLHTIYETHDSSFDRANSNSNHSNNDAINNCDNSLMSKQKGTQPEKHQSKKNNRIIQTNCNINSNNNILHNDKSAKTSNADKILKTPPNKEPSQSPRSIQQNQPPLVSDAAVSAIQYRPSFVFFNQPPQHSKPSRTTTNNPHRSQTVSGVSVNNSNNNNSTYGASQEDDNNKLLPNKRRIQLNAGEQLNQQQSISSEERSGQCQLGQNISHRTIQQLQEEHQCQDQLEIPKQPYPLVSQLLREKAQRKLTQTTPPSPIKDHKSPAQELPQVRHKFRNADKLMQNNLHELPQLNHTEFSFSQNQYHYQSDVQQQKGCFERITTQT